MKQQNRASLSIPVTLKNAIKQRAAGKNLFIVEYLARLVLYDVEPLGHQRFDTSSVDRAKAPQDELASAGTPSTYGGT